MGGSCSLLDLLQILTKTGATTLLLYPQTGEGDHDACEDEDGEDGDGYNDGVGCDGS